jgi:hypothetical protein
MQSARTDFYAYVGGNPVSYVDPRGENPAAALPWASGGAEAGFAASPVGWAALAGIGGYALGSIVYDQYGNQISEWIWNLTHPDDPTSGSVYSNGLPPGYWPGPAGAAEWGHRNGVGAREAKNRFHRGVKQNCSGSKPTHVFGVNHATGDVVDRPVTWSTT